MTVKQNSQTYAYALIAIVAAVALVAIALILKTQGVLLSLPDENVQGEAQAAAPALYHGTPTQMVRVGEQIHASEQGTVTLASLSTTGASVTYSEGESGADLALGESATFGDLTVTLVDIDRQGVRSLFAVTTQAQACTVGNGQSPTCRGERTCCDGACIQLPDCASADDGAALTCGQRTLYCCGGQLTGVPCDAKPPQPACTSDLNCESTQTCVQGTCVPLNAGESVASQDASVGATISVRFAIDQNAPTQDVARMLDVATDILDVPESLAAGARVPFDDVKATHVEDEFLIAFSGERAVVIIGTGVAITPETIAIAADIAQALDTRGVQYAAVRADELASDALEDLFPTSGGAQ